MKLKLPQLLQPLQTKNILFEEAIFLSKMAFSKYIHDTRQWLSQLEYT